MFNCHYCYAIFSNNRSLQDHEARHRRRYVCLVCNSTHPTRYSLFRHTQNEGHYIPKTANTKLPVNARVAHKGQTTRPPREFGKRQQEADKGSMPADEVAKLNRLTYTNSRTVSGTAGPRFRIPLAGTTSRNLPSRASTPVPKSSKTSKNQKTSKTSKNRKTSKTSKAPETPQTPPENAENAENMDISAMARDLFGTDSEDDNDKDFNHKR